MVHICSDAKAEAKTDGSKGNPQSSASEQVAIKRKQQTTEVRHDKKPMTLDKVVKGNDAVAIDGLFSAIEAAQHLLMRTDQADYSRMFAYLGELRAYSAYESSYAAYHSPVLSEHESEEDFFNPVFSDDLIDEIIRAKKIRDTYGIEVYVNPMKKGIFDIWKFANSGEVKLRYDLISI